MLVKKINAQSLKIAGTILRSNGVIVYPTDTAYGLGGIFDSTKVKKNILKIKKRSDPKFTLIASSLLQVKKYFKLNKQQLMLAKKYWPGPLSLVVSDKYAVRVPDNEIARQLARLAGKPIIATSANLTGQPTIYSAKAAAEEFALQKDRPDLILDAGKLRKIKTSTIVQVKNEEIVVIRQGAVKIN